MKITKNYSVPYHLAYVTHVSIYKLDNKIESALVMNQSAIFEKFIVLILDVR